VASKLPTPRHQLLRITRDTLATTMGNHRVYVSRLIRAHSDRPCCVGNKLPPLLVIRLRPDLRRASGVCSRVGCVVAAWPEVISACDSMAEMSSNKRKPWVKQRVLSYTRISR
jgi:hypothetical protein